MARRQQLASPMSEFLGISAVGVILVFGGSLVFKDALSPEGFIAFIAMYLIRLSGLVPYKDINIEFIGLRPGEKLYEEMLMDEEGIRETENELIYIGHPIELDEEKFLRHSIGCKRLCMMTVPIYAESFRI